MADTARLSQTRNRRTAARTTRALQHEAFVLEDIGNGANGTKAYMAAYPECTSVASAASSAWRLLRNVEVKARLLELRTAMWKRLEMSGEESLALVAGDARADIRELYDEHNQLLAPHLWPDSVANSVKAIRPGPFGWTVILNDSLAARRIILEQTGKLKNPLTRGMASLARILAGDFKEDDE